MDRRSCSDEERRGKRDSFREFSTLKYVLSIVLTVFLSCIAGFMEPGESIEDTVRREAREEIGVNVGRIVYHSSQPWPMPGQLMMGMIAQVEGSTEFDPEEDELEEARWFSRDSILEALEPKKGKKAEFSLPPQYAMWVSAKMRVGGWMFADTCVSCSAHQILRAWAHQEVEFPDNTGKAKL